MEGAFAPEGQGPGQGQGSGQGQATPSTQTRGDKQAVTRERIRRAVAQAAEEALAQKPKRPQIAALAHGTTDGIDRRTAERMRRGKMVIDGRIDLHGMSRDAAQAVITQYILTAQATGKRCIIVVTGKGRGILQDAVPQWLNMHPLRACVLAFDWARREHGGDGALYVLLKRQRG
jgi:DNA-nicking Smr family endonuclease